ncbi:MAG: RCC1 repeat-containing protein, partial [Dehalococcoidia bacterium]
MQLRSIAGALLLVAATAGLQWAGASDQAPGPRAETALNALAPAGVARSWGNDDNGELGNSLPFVDQDAPVAVSGLTNVVELSAGDHYSLALLSDSTVMSWGSDTSGQLGNGATTGNQAAPVAVSGLSGVKAVAAGFRHSLALLSDGTVMSWGADTSGQLGNGATTGDQASPVAVSGLSSVKAVAGGASHTLALLSDGTVMSWGNDGNGQLGNGATTGDQAAPVAVSGLSGVRAIAAGIYHSLALLSDGTVMSWGADTSGQLGNGATTGNQAAPVAVSGLSGVKAIAGGGTHSLARLSNGTVMSWGSDTYGQLGNGATTGNQAAPVAV